MVRSCCVAPALWPPPPRATVPSGTAFEAFGSGSKCRGGGAVTLYELSRACVDAGSEPEARAAGLTRAGLGSAGAAGGGSGGSGRLPPDAAAPRRAEISERFRAQSSAVCPLRPLADTLAPRSSSS